MSHATPLTLKTQSGQSLTLTPENPPTITLSRNGINVLHATIPGLAETANPKTVLGQSGPISHTLSYPKGATIKITLRTHDTFRLQITAPDDAVELALQTHPSQWFGLGHLMHQHWPLQSSSLPIGPLYPFDNGPTGICTLVEPTFYTTSGVCILADDSSRCLHVAINAAEEQVLKWGVGVANFDRKILPTLDDGRGDGLLRLISRAQFDYEFVQHPWKLEAAHNATGNHNGTGPALDVALFAEGNVKQVCEKVLEELAGVKSACAPPRELMQYPIWSTWARYKDSVTQADVLEFANDIVNRGLPRSVMGIDDRWSVKYGDLDFDRVKFPDPAAMISQLHSLGFLVTLWVTPFANTDSSAVTNPATRKHFVHTNSGQLGDFAWWQPTRVAALDVTDSSAVDWFVGELNSLRNRYGLDGFKFDAGEPSFLPEDCTLQRTMNCPADYTRAWIRDIASKFPVSEVRSGVRGCQGAAPMFRLFDKFSTWGLENGLASVVAGLLTSGILGYPFCIPDYIAGNAYGDEVPDAELMVRWAQASAAMPAMQFSIPPWDMGAECEELCAEALRWRERFFWERIEGCVGEAVEKYTPIARPVWWVEPVRTDAAAIFDQFLIGDDVLVAPVLQEGARARKVFLPSGVWRRVNLKDGSFGEDVSGPAWFENISAPLDDMPTYVRAC